MTLKLYLYLLPKFRRVPFTIVLISGIDQWPKSHLGLDALSNQKILKGIYCICRSLDYFFGVLNSRATFTKQVLMLSLQNHNASTWSDTAHSKFGYLVSNIIVVQKSMELRKQ